MERVFDCSHINIASTRHAYVSRKLLTEISRLPFVEMTMECSPVGLDTLYDYSYVRIDSENAYLAGKKIKLKMDYSLTDFDMDGNEENTFILYNYADFIDSKIESLLSDSNNRNIDYQYKYTFK